jgi:hypothetical protein
VNTEGLDGVEKGELDAIEVALDEMRAALTEAAQRTETTEAALARLAGNKRTIEMPEERFIRIAGTLLAFLNVHTRLSVRQHNDAREALMVAVGEIAETVCDAVGHPDSELENSIARLGEAMSRDLFALETRYYDSFESFMACAQLMGGTAEAGAAA